ncbi:SPFH domain-containing protein [Saxibacter everestensis]|uniref:SPFH domain-containing protein n=1 Tax=Saxibacter everestensis TaxID=2909229 RepID=A0ABY8QQD2_9MICO|nr:SPFH domain-containing protein [Brevibacteriaceae bacterium ZFBP1038]
MTWLVVLAVATVLVLWRSVVRVPGDHSYVVERMGKFHRVCVPGMHLVVPILEKVAHRVNLREQVLRLPCVTVNRRDEADVSNRLAYDITVSFTVRDPRKASYRVPNHALAVEQLSVTTIRNCGSWERTDRELGGMLEQALRDSLPQCGLALNRAEVVRR